jgi:hypothetical protein
VLEVVEVAGGHAGAVGDLLLAEAELAAAVGDAAGEIARGRGRHDYLFAL